MAIPSASSDPKNLVRPISLANANSLSPKMYYFNIFQYFTYIILSSTLQKKQKAIKTSKHKF